MTAGVRILRYLKRTQKLGLEYTTDNERKFRKAYSATNGDLDDCITFCDADWAADTVTMKSTSGICVYFRGVALLWSSRKQSIVATSTAAAEYCAIHDAIELTKGHGFLAALVPDSPDLPRIFNDNQSAL